MWPSCQATANGHGPWEKWQTEERGWTKETHLSTVGRKKAHSPFPADGPNGARQFLSEEDRSSINKPDFPWTASLVRVPSPLGGALIWLRANKTIWLTLWCWYLSIIHYGTCIMMVELFWFGLEFFMLLIFFWVFTKSLLCPFSGKYG